MATDAFFLSSLAAFFLLLRLTAATGRSQERCGFPAIYNFGDSNSDTGAISATLSEILPPNGESFFGKPAGRNCDGRLIIDFAAENLGLPYLSPYLDSVGANFRHGANFATGGSSIRPGGFSPFDLSIQISQFIQFKARTIALYNQLSPDRTMPPFKSGLPRPEDFSKALYTFDIGQNDIGYGLQHGTDDQVQASFPDILNKFSDAVELLYKEGARFFWVHNTGPFGCLPYNIIYYSLKPNNLDRNGCVIPQNELSKEFNRQLKEKVSWLRTKLSQAVFTYVDVYSAKYTVINDAKNLGFVDPSTFCCGSYYGYHIDCGKKAVVNGTVYGNPCDHPASHISWDGIHYSQAANQWIANRIFTGSFSEPPVPIWGSCRDSSNVRS